MKLEKNTYYWLGAAALITVIGIVVYKKRKKKQAELAANNVGVSNKNKNQELSTIEEQLQISPFPIKLGAEGDAVKAIQKYINSTCPSELKKEGIYPLDINGIWDETTDKAALACSVLKRNEIDKTSFDRILRDLQSANISV